MKLIIKTRDIKIEYQDDYSLLEAAVKDRIESIIKTIQTSQPVAAAPVKMTAEEFFNKKQKVMNNEQIIDEVYNNYLAYIHDVVQGENQIYGDWYGKEEFTNKCKTNPEFSEKWELKIEERELSLEEREKLAIDKYPRLNEIPYGALVDMQPFTNEFGDSLNIPTKLITITYKDKTIESYE